MTEIRRFAAVFLLLVLLSSCAAPAEEGGPFVDVYYMLAEDQVSSGALVRSERAEAGSDAIASAVARLNASPATPGLRRPFPAGVGITGRTLMPDGELVLDLSAGYLTLSGIEKSAADYCLALTFCGLDGVEAVSVRVNGVIVTSGLLAEDALLYDSEVTPYDKRLKLYFADEGGRYLGIEYHSLTVSEGASLERCVMEELLRGSYGDKLYSAIPENTRLLSVYTENGLCTVDLSQEFLVGKPASIADSRLAVYSVVNSLCSLSDVNEVTILVDGRRLEQYGELSLPPSLSANESAASPAVVGRGERDANFFIALRDSDHLTPVPAKISTAGYISEALAAADKLLNGLHEPMFRSLFPPEETEFELRLSDGTCFVLLHADDIAWCNAHGCGNLAAQSIIATLTQFRGITRVSIGCIDGSSTLDGINISSRYTAKNDIIVR